MPTRNLWAAAVMAVGFLASSAQAVEFNYKDMLIAIIKLTPAYDYENNADALMQVFRPSVWQNVRNDEFEKESKRTETIDMIKKMVAAYNPDDPVVIHTNIDFGEYDFAQHRFAMHPFTETAFYNVQFCCASPLPSDIKIFFSNPDFIDGIPMEAEAAKAFLNRHKAYGNINRQLHIDIAFKPVSLKGEDAFTSEIVKAVVTDPMTKIVVMTLPASATTAPPHS